MKKKLLVVPLLLFILTGCGNSEMTMLTCRATFAIDEYTEFASEHIMYAVGDDVHVVTSTESVRSEQEELLDDYRGRLNEIKDTFNRLPFYTFNVFEEEGIITTIRMVNYKRINMDDLLTLDSNNQQLMRNGRVSLNVMREFYEENGAICN